MKKYLLLLLLLAPSAVKASTVTPAFTQGSMQSTTNTTQNITETSHTQVYGGDYASWAGTNITPSADISGHGATFDITTPGEQFQLEIVTRAAGLVEETNITRDIETISTTTSLSVFSQ